MVRQTSIEAYNEIVSNGLLTRARLDVYRILFEHGPLTAGEIFEKSNGRDGVHSLVKGSICARLTELREQGVVQEVGKKEWELTGHTNLLWDVTTRLPSPLPRKKSNAQIIKELQDTVKMMEGIIARQNKEIDFLSARDKQEAQKKLVFMNNYE